MKKCVLALLVLLGLACCTGASAAVLKLPAGLRTLPAQAFSGDKALDEVILPDGLLEIGSRAFAGSSVAKINLPASLKSIASDALSGCPEGLVVTAEEGSYAWGWAVANGYITPPAVNEGDFDYVVSGDGSATVTGYHGPGGYLVVPATLQGHPVTAIGEKAFYWEKDITGICLPNGLKEIGYAAFEESGIECAVLPDSLATISEYAFKGTDLQFIRIPDGVTEIPGHAFAFCIPLQEVVLPHSLTSIGEEAFSDCIRLLFDDTLFPASLRSIGDQAFCSIRGSTIHFTGNAPTIGKNAFKDSYIVAVYPHADLTWTEDVRRDYGAKWLTWRSDAASDIPDTARDASEALVSEVTSNWNDMVLVGDDLEYVAPSIGSMLVPGEDGMLTRVERTMDTVVIEEHSPEGELLWKKRIAYELPLWGGFYAGKTHNFLVFGQLNLDEDDSCEVIRVVRYTKNWHRVDAASVCGANTRVPFDATGISMAEAGDFLYLHTSHGMYVTPDGKGHQGNLCCEIYMPTMSVVRWDYDYVTHSFEQFCITDGDAVVQVDHGDYSPRKVLLEWMPGSADTPAYRDGHYITLLNLAENHERGIVLAGLEASDTHYLLSGWSIDHQTVTISYNIFVITLDKKNMSDDGVRLIWHTRYPEGGDIIEEPKMVKIDPDRFLILWMEVHEPEPYNFTRTTHWLFINGKGEATSKIYQCDGRLLSNCPPVLSGNRVVWYYTDQSTPTFYAIDLSNPSKLLKW